MLQLIKSRPYDGIHNKNYTQNKYGGVPVMARWVKNQHSIPGDRSLIPGLAQWVKDLAWPQAAA